MGSRVDIFFPNKGEFIHTIIDRGNIRIGGAGSSSGAVCAPVVFSVNSTEVKTVQSGSPYNLDIINSALQSVGIFAADKVTVQDGQVVVKDSAGNTLYTVNVASNGAVNRPVGDSVVEIRDTAGAVLYTVSVLAEGSDFRVVGDSTVNVRKSDGVLIAAVPVKAQATEPYNVANSTVTMKDTAGATLDSKSVKATESAEFTAPNATAPIKDSAGTLLKTEVFKSGETRDVGIGNSTFDVKDSGGVTLHTKTVKAQGTAEQVVSDSVLTLNSGAFLNVKAQASQNIQLLSSVDDSPIVPVSVVGPVIKVAPGGGTPSGVLFQKQIPTQYTAYRTGDVGDRVQSAWFNYIPPATPKVIAELDFTNANFFTTMKNPLVVDGVSSVRRFVDVDGGQTWSATGNKNLATIDKLTAKMWRRLQIGTTSWANHIDNALSYSVVIDGITYDDWYLASLDEILQVFHNYAGVNGNVDPATSAAYLEINISNNITTANTNPSNTAQCWYFDNASRNYAALSKASTGGAVYYVRKCDNLITAP